MKKRKNIMIWLLFVGIFSTLAGCRAQGVKPEQQSPPVAGQPQQNESPKNTEEGEAELGIFVGNRAYDFRGLDAEGNEISLRDFEGKPVFVNFWASWCPPCREEMPEMQEVYEEYKDQAGFVAINAGERQGTTTEDVEAFLDDIGFQLPIIYDDGTIARDYRIQAIPMTYIIDKNGIITYVIRGSADKETMIQALKTAIQE